jgi:hypothetical protein
MAKPRAVNMAVISCWTKILAAAVVAMKGPKVAETLTKMLYVMTGRLKAGSLARTTLPNQMLAKSQMAHTTDWLELYGAITVGWVPGGVVFSRALTADHRASMEMAEPTQTARAFRNRFIKNLPLGTACVVSIVQGAWACLPGVGHTYDHREDRDDGDEVAQRGEVGCDWAGLQHCEADCRGE